ncbi:NAD(+) synthase [candidate division CSSED10-310 bacterium]|uniref:NH(3)-dependent NAD(+) synthetase n=1 Tax=candidate division CSSED10-310 bacterium TaxID=2855610 RepID=A0ABV6YRL6_UNCC1
MMDTTQILDFFRQQVAVSKTKGVVIGLSGGIDSTLTTYLAVHALGKQNVTGLCLPHKEQSYELGYHLKELLGIKVEVFNIAPMVEATITENPDLFDTRLQQGNLHARARMCFLYAYAAKYKLLVAGTTNKSEFEVGYLTKFGDGAVDFEPICHLLKTEVYVLAKKIGIPEIYITQKPTAGLWEDQTDEDELGFSYDRLDQVLQGKSAGISNQILERIADLRAIAKHKQQTPPSLLS